MVALAHESGLDFSDGLVAALSCARTANGDFAAMESEQAEGSLAVIVLGPTGSGKTALSLKLADEFGGEIVSCDSVAVYRGMELGTAKPTLEERIVTPLANALAKLDRDEPIDPDEHLPAKLDPSYKPAPIDPRNPNRRGMATVQHGLFRVGIAEQDGTFGEREAEVQGRRCVGPDKRTKYYIVDTPEVPVNIIPDLTDEERDDFERVQRLLATDDLQAQAEALRWEARAASLTGIQQKALTQGDEI